MFMLSFSVWVCPVLAFSHNLFLFLVRIRADLTTGTQLTVCSCFPFCNFSVTISDALSPRDKAISFRHTQNQMHVPLGQFGCTYSLKNSKKTDLSESLVLLLSVCLPTGVILVLHRTRVCFTTDTLAYKSCLFHSSFI